MTNRSANLTYNCGDLNTKDPQSINLSAAFLRITKCRKTNFNKTWHANCTDRAVSKILDWLVK